MKRVVLIIFLLILFCRFRRRTLSKRLFECSMKRLRSQRLLRCQRFVRLLSSQRMCFVFVLSKAMKQIRVRNVWQKERSSLWWTDIVQKIFNDRDWLDNFHMRHSTFLYLCEELHPLIGQEDTQMRKSIPVDQHVGITLWYLATCSEYRTISHLFGVAESTVCTIVKEVCRAISSDLSKKFIKFHSGNSLKEVVDGYRTKFGFPNCIGAVDGCHIPIIAPREDYQDYYNRKGWYLISTVDYKYCFSNLFVGWPGKVHNARVFRESSLFEKAEAGTLFPWEIFNVNRTQLPLVMLGDSAYPLMSWLMKPFPQQGGILSR